MPICRRSCVDREDTVRTNLRKHAELFTRYSLAFRLNPNLVIAPLHQRLLQPHGVPYELILLKLCLAAAHLQSLQYGVKARIVPDTQQEQQVEPGDFALILRRARTTPSRGWQVVEWLQLLVVAGEGLCILEPDAEQCALLEHRDGEDEMLCRGVFVRYEGVDLE